MLEIVAFFRVLPELIKFIIEAQKFLNTAFGNTPEQKLREFTQAIQSLRQSKTTEDRIDALERIQKQLQKIS